MVIMHLAHAVAGHPLIWSLGIEPLKQIRLFVVSGIRLLREGLARSLQTRRRTDVALVGCAGFSEAGTAGLSDLRPDVILVDLANHEGLAATSTLRSLSPTSKLIAFSVADTLEAALSCAAAGFSGYLTREASVDDLLRTVRAVGDGRMTCPPHIAAAMLDRLANGHNPPKSANGASLLTARERQILMLSDEGWSNKDIGRRLEISPSTVKNHIHSILQKLQVERRGQAAARLRGANGVADG
jgi:two-component system, NarL family, nitrate/nitrite response regulator NarL